MRKIFFTTGLFLLFFINGVGAQSVEERIANANAVTTKTKCTGHRHVASLRPRGFEHVNHTLSVDGVKIKEVEGWFVESIECTGTGFTIKLSHKQYQYDDPASEATLHMLTKGRYEWKWLE